MSTLNMKYKLDINSMPNQASNIIAQLKDAGITSILCGCDPVMLALGLTPKANEQDYEPEWMTAGLAFVDQDIVSQLIDQTAVAARVRHRLQRRVRAAGPARSRTPRTSRCGPNDEPAFGVEEIYYQMYMLAIGMQMAGPNLTPQTFEAGMFAYPGGSGRSGSWRFGPGDYTPTDDFREIWWDPDRISPQNNKPGAWVQLNGGARYLPGQVPSDGPAVTSNERATMSRRSRRDFVSPLCASEPVNRHVLRGFGPLVVGARPVRPDGRCSRRRSRPSVRRSCRRRLATPTTTASARAVSSAFAHSSSAAPCRSCSRSSSCTPRCTGCRARPLPDRMPWGVVAQGVIFGT